MEVSQETATRGRTQFNRGRSLIVVFFGLMLVAFGVIFIVIGRNAIEQRSYDMPWQESRGFFIGIGEIRSQSSSGVAHFRGAEAVRVGAGFALFGALLTLWGAMLVRSAFHTTRPAKETFARPRGAGLVVALASFALLLGAQVCFFPVWRIDGLVFWCMIVGLPMIVGSLQRLRKARWTGALFMGLIVLAMLVPDREISFAIAMGIFGTVFCVGHLVFLFPNVLFRE